MTSIRKTFTVLECLGNRDGDQASRLVDLVERTGLSKPTVHRILQELKDYGLVTQDPQSNAYAIGPKALVLASRYRGGVSLQRAALPEMRALARDTGATIHLGVRDGLSAVYIEKVESPQPIVLASRVGHTAPLYCTAMGKTMLAFGDPGLAEAVSAQPMPARTANTLDTPDRLHRELAQIRDRGFAIDEEENEVGVRCLSAPIFDHRGDLVAAMSISGTLTQVPREALPRLGETITAACERVSHALGGSGAGHR